MFRDDSNEQETGWYIQKSEASKGQGFCKRRNGLDMTTRSIAVMQVRCETKTTSI